MGGIKRVKDICVLHEQLCIRFRKFTRHEHIHFTGRGNTALFIALHIAKNVNGREFVMIPDQGGWYSYKTYPAYFGLKVKEAKTDYGLLNVKGLKNVLADCSALILPSFAGYFAEQEIRKISSVCKKAGCLLIEDASGSIGDRKLCNGKYSDIIIGSFDRDSVIGYGYGGFISAGKKAYFDACRQAFSLTKVHPRFYLEIMKFVRRSKFRKLLELAKRVKEEIGHFDKNISIVHAEKRGVNVVAKYSPSVIAYCRKMGFQYLLCPKYTRINMPAVSIELISLSRGEIDERLKK
ncbi:DegT/DnrJ/EryC1/StrS family aminotransferase [archaeon]|nr:DegT/DnrJ/EryC1/StrS family aminotransferase [archaeon]